MVFAAPDLPDDVDALKAMVLALSRKAVLADVEIAQLKTLNATADERNARLTSIIKMLERAATAAAPNSSSATGGTKSSTPLR